MLRLVLGALRARRAQTVAVFALTALATLGGSAAPWFTSWARSAVAQADIQTAPAIQRVVTITATIEHKQGSTAALTALRQQAAAALAVDGGTVSVAAQVYASSAKPTGSPPIDRIASGLFLGSRTGVCEEVRIVGRCPASRGEVLLEQSTADTTGLAPGDEVVLQSARMPSPVTMRVTGTYTVNDALSPYWAGSGLQSAPPGGGPASVSVAAFVTEDTMVGLDAVSLDVEYHVQLPDAVFIDPGPSMVERMRQTRAGLMTSPLRVRSAADQLAAQISQDRALVLTGVQVAAAELVLVSWFALYLAVRHTSVARRGDIGLLRLRGVSGWRVWALIGQQSAVPMGLGVATGLVLGYGCAAALAGDPAALRPTGGGVYGFAGTVATAVAVALGVGLGALLSAMIAEWRALRAPVTTLLRQVPSRRSGWRATAVDGVVLLLALGGVYQGYAERGSPSVLALLAPGLVVLAFGLLIGRVLPYAAAQAGAATMRSGRAGASLSALSIARRPGTDRTFTVLAVCVGIAATSTFGWLAAADAWSQRAAVELGAPRVLEVRAESSAALLAAVRSVVPAGDHAMAAAVMTTGPVRILAVDATRLATVALVRDDYGLPDLIQLGAELHPPRPELARIHDGLLDVEATDASPAPPASLAPADPPRPLVIRVHLEQVDGAWQHLDLGLLGPGRGTYQAPVTGCGEAGCRLVALELVTTRDEAAITLHRLSSAGREIVGSAVWRDVSRWRPPNATYSLGPILRTAPDGLTVIKFPGQVPSGMALDQRVFVADSAAPLPAMLTGSRPLSTRPGDNRLLVMGLDEVPYRMAGTATVLPRIGPGAALVDLEYARRLTGRATERVALEVWLTADAPDALVEGLERAGVTVVTDTTLAELTAQLAARGPGVALRFQLLAALVLVLLAAGAVVVAASVEGRDRADELQHLRRQGLARRSARFAGYAGTLLVVGAATVTGLVAAVIAHDGIASALPIFVDDWGLLPSTAGVAPSTAFLFALAAGSVLIGVSIAVTHRLLRPIGGPR